MPPRGKYNKIDDTMRMKIIQSIFDDQLTISATARRFKYPRTTVANIAYSFEKEGKTSVKRRGGERRARVITEEHLDWLTGQLLENPSKTIKALTQELNEAFSLNPPISRRTVHDAVAKKGAFTLKLSRYEPEDFNAPGRIKQRVTWCQQFLKKGWSMTDAVYIDEAGFNLHLTRRYGRAPKGQRACVVRPTQRGRNISVIVAVGREGIIGFRAQLGAVNAGIFLDFVNEAILPRLNTPRVVLADKVPFHKDSRIRHALEAHGHTYVNLPPYSPHLDAAEYVFGHIKDFVKQQQLRDGETLIGFIRKSIQNVTAEMAQGWLREVNRNFGRAIGGEPLGKLYT
jgi:transposase